MFLRPFSRSFRQIAINHNVLEFVYCFDSNFFQFIRWLLFHVYSFYTLDEKRHENEVIKCSNHDFSGSRFAPISSPCIYHIIAHHQNVEMRGKKIRNFSWIQWKSFWIDPFFDELIWCSDSKLMKAFTEWKVLQWLSTNQEKYHAASIWCVLLCYYSVESYYHCRGHEKALNISFELPTAICSTTRTKHTSNAMWILLCHLCARVYGVFAATDFRNFMRMFDE